MRTTSKQKPKTWTFWAGFAEGKLDIWVIDDGWGGVSAPEARRMSPCLFKTRRQARQRFQDVRKVTITLAPKKRRGK